MLPLRRLTPATPLPLIERSSAWPELLALFETVGLREPPLADASRWHEHLLGGKLRRFAQPLTFTPYAAAQPCSARCRFCSETLRDGSDAAPMAAGMRPGPGYFDQLGEALQALRGVPLSYSLSGLESTDDAAWFLRLLATLRHARATGQGPQAQGAVLYTNGNGLEREGPALLAALAGTGLSWIEWSRHHDDAATNQRIMRFRAGIGVQHDGRFETAMHRALAHAEVRLVCVVQAGGIRNAEDVVRYLAWAQGLGVRHVIFRALSALPADYAGNVTRRYVDSHRIGIDELLLDCLASAQFRQDWRPRSLTSGYYFWNARWEGAGNREVVFEASDYGVMHEHEDDERIYKLVFHANGNLCAGWQPTRHVLWRPAC